MIDWGYFKKACANAAGLVLSLFVGVVFKPMDLIVTGFQEALAAAQIAVDFTAYTSILGYAQAFVDLNFAFGLMETMGVFLSALWLFRVVKSFLPNFWKVSQQ